MNRNEKARRGAAGVLFFPVISPAEAAGGIHDMAPRLSVQEVLTSASEVQPEDFFAGNGRQWLHRIRTDAASRGLSAHLLSWPDGTRAMFLLPRGTSAPIRYALPAYTAARLCREGVSP